MDIQSLQDWNAKALLAMIFLLFSFNIKLWKRYTTLSGSILNSWNFYGHTIPSGLKDRICHMRLKTLTTHHRRIITAKKKIHDEWPWRGQIFIKKVPVTTTPSGSNVCQKIRFWKTNKIKINNPSTLSLKTQNLIINK